VGSPSIGAAGPDHRIAIALVAGILLLALPAPARAQEAVFRVIADRADVHTGPGFGYRVIHVAARGDVLEAIERATRDDWLRVQLADGTYGWVLGDEVQPMEVDASAADYKPSIWRRMADAVFSPPPLLDGHVGLTFSAGVLGGDGLVLFRPAVLLEPHVALEGFFGETVGDQIDVLYYGGGANVYLAPSSPVTPFLSLGGGGARGRKKADQFTIHVGKYSIIEAGGGLLVALKKRITLRADVRHYVIFDPNHTVTAREYSGGLAVVF